MFAAHIRFCIAPVSDQTARTAPITSTVSPVPRCWLIVVRLLSRRLVACVGTTWWSLSISVAIACGPARRLKSPTPISNADGIARNA